MLWLGLLSLSCEISIRNINCRPGIGIVGAQVNNIRYADDIVLIAGTKEELQDLGTTINKERRNMGLSANIKKTETPVISKGKTNLYVIVSYTTKH